MCGKFTKDAMTGFYRSWRGLWSGNVDSYGRLRAEDIDIKNAEVTEERFVFALW